MIKIQYALFFSFVIQNLVKKSVLNRMSTMQGSAQDVLRKDKLIAFFVEHFKGNHVNVKSVCFQFYNPKLS